jgi:hypothetical protein
MASSLLRVELWMIEMHVGSEELSPVRYLCVRPALNADLATGEDDRCGQQGTMNHQGINIARQFHFVPIHNPFAHMAIPIYPSRLFLGRGG